MHMYTNPCVLAGASGWGQASELLLHLHCGAHQHRHLATAGLKSVQGPGMRQKTTVRASTVSDSWLRWLYSKHWCNGHVYPLLSAASLSFNRAFQSLSWVFVAALEAQRNRSPNGMFQTIVCERIIRMDCGWILWTKNLKQLKKH